jgi:hypothetical protein
MREMREESEGMTPSSALFERSRVRREVRLSREGMVPFSRLPERSLSKSESDKTVEASWKRGGGG